MICALRTRGADDRAAFVSLIKELRLAFEGEAVSNKLPRLLLTAAVPASPEAIAAGYEVPEVVKYVDFLNVMTYDFHGHWEGQVGHNSPLFPLETAASHQRKLTVVGFHHVSSHFQSILSTSVTRATKLDRKGSQSAKCEIWREGNNVAKS